MEQQAKRSCAGCGRHGRDAKLNLRSLLAPLDDESKVCVAGPQDARPIRDLPAGRILDLLEANCSMPSREAAAFLAREFRRLDEAVVPGLRDKDHLTPLFLRERLRWPINEQRPSSAVEGLPPLAAAWHGAPFQGRGYQIEPLPHQAYLLRRVNAPLAGAHPHRDAWQCSRPTTHVPLPAGIVLAHCRQHDAHRGILAAEGRYRLF